MKFSSLHKLTAFVFTLLFVACNITPQTKQEETTTAKENDTLKKLSALFKEELKLPLVIDSAFLAKEKFGDSLGTGELKLLGRNWFKHELTGSMDYDLQEFYKIDSIKATGTYPQWSEKLDIGMTKYANAYTIGKAKLDDNTELLVWVFKISSYEACPYSSGTTVYFTPLNQSATGENFILGESFGAGDAPVWMTRDIYGKLDPDGTIGLKWKEVHDDGEGTESEAEERNYTFMVKHGNIKVIKEEKEKTYKIPHPNDSIQ